MASHPLPPSEGSLPGSEALHHWSAEQLLERFEAEDHHLIAAVAGARQSILRLAELMEDALGADCRLIYVGAGTSGRLAALDAAEWEPTFGIPRERLCVLMAGGEAALSRAVEGAEDRAHAARRDLEDVQLGVGDAVVGISASGGAAYVLEALAVARETGCARAFITTNRDALVDDPDLVRVQLDTGAEILAGSTRLKAAAATHLVLQRASNLCALKCGWIHGGRMVEMRPTNAKLWARAVRIVAELGRAQEAAAEAFLDAAGGDIKVALVCACCAVEPAEARRKLDAVNRVLARIPELS